MKTHFVKSFSWLILASTMAIASLSGCRNNEEPAPNPVEARPACKITKTYNVAYPTSYWSNQFDQQDNLLRQTYYEDDVAYIIRANKHNEKGQIVEQSLEYQNTPNATPYVYSFTYNEKGQVTKITTQNHQSRCEYDAAGNRTKITQTITATGDESIFTFEYKDGNCIKAIYPGLDSESIYEYEYYPDQVNKLAPFERVNGYLMGQSPNRNMLKKMTLTEKDRSGTTVSSWEHAYEYNGKGFPVKMFQTGETISGTSSTGVYISEYICQ